MILTIYLLSTSDIKINGVKSFIKDISSDEKISFLLKPVSIDTIISDMNYSSLPPQPVNEHGLMCGLKRIEYFKSVQKKYMKIDDEEHSIIISIENYIQENTKYYDTCVFIVSYMGKTIYGISDQKRAYFPEKYFTTIKDTYKTYDNLCGYSKTIGSVIHEEYPDVSSNNWMNKFNDFDRNDQIINAYENIDMKELLSQFIEIISDFPKPNVVFQDILPLLSNPFLSSLLFSSIMKQISTTSCTFDYVVGLESRGFFLAPIIAEKLGCAFIPIRKSGKLPPPVYTYSYEKEYGKDVAEISQKHKHGCRFLVVDDILATGGSLLVSKRLLDHFEPKHISFFVLSKVIELEDVAKQTLGDDHRNVISLFN